jgi:hypothetical protein
MDVSLVAKGLAARVADVEATLERHASFAFRPDDTSPSPAPGDGDASAVARDLVRRAFAALSDPINDRLLRALAEGDAPLVELAAVAALPRLVVWEHVNDLVQVGVARHALEGDRAGLTGAGAALVELVDELASAIAEQGHP